MINAALDSANVEDISVTDSSTVETPVKTGSHCIHASAEPVFGLLMPIPAQH